MIAQLLEIERNHPALCSIVGIGGGVGAWILKHAPELTTIGSLIGIWCGALIGLIAVSAKVVNMVRNWVRIYREWRYGPPAVPPFRHYTREDYERDYLDGPS